MQKEHSICKTTSRNINIKNIGHNITVTYWIHNLQTKCYYWSYIILNIVLENHLFYNDKHSVSMSLILHVRAVFYSFSRILYALCNYT